MILEAEDDVLIGVDPLRGAPTWLRCAPRQPGGCACGRGERRPHSGTAVPGRVRAAVHGLDALALTHGSSNGRGRGGRPIGPGTWNNVHAFSLEWRVDSLVQSSVPIPSARCIRRARATANAIPSHRRIWCEDQAPGVRLMRMTMVTLPSGDSQ
jgi:hypothetical protein